MFCLFEFREEYCRPPVESIMSSREVEPGGRDEPVDPVDPRRLAKTIAGDFSRLLLGRRIGASFALPIRREARREGFPAPRSLVRKAGLAAKTL
jgi:hypothetical protein